MKIIQINSHYNQGGAGKIVTCLHHALIEKGYESVVVYGRGNSTIDDSVYRIGNKYSNRVDALITRMIGINGFESWSATRKLIGIIEREEPNVLHLHGLHGYYLNYSILFNYINRYNIPCVWTFHDCLAFTGKCGYPYSCIKYINGCYDCEKLRDYPATYGFDFSRWMWSKKKELFTETDNKIIISPSEWMTEIARTSFFSKYECKTIHNGIDTDNVFYLRDKLACRERLGIGKEEKVALGIAFGQDDPRKGVKYILQAAKDLKSVNVNFILIGWNEKNDHLLYDLDNVKTLRFTSDQDELALYYSAADVFLLPSLAENYATTVIESLACGTPVIGFDVGGVPNQLKDGLGIVVPLGDQLAFEKAIISVLNRSVDLLMPKQISSITAKNNSVKAMSESYIDIYEEIDI